MTRIFVDDLTEGMVLASDLVTPKGRFILAEGATLQANHLKILKSWGVSEADIVDDSADLGAKDAEAAAENYATANAFLVDKFVGHDLEQELLAELFRQVRERLAQKLCEGYELPVLSEMSFDSKEPPQQIDKRRLISGETELASLPAVYTRIVETLNSPRTSSSLLASIVSKDASLSARLLRLVNSAFYGFPSKIDSISRGVTLLGTNELTTLALGISVVRLFQNMPTELIDMEVFWKHSIRCGLFAQLLAGHKVGLSEEKLFVGGLLHDIGRLIMLRKVPQPYAEAILLSRREHLPLFSAEQALLGCDHAEVGRMLSEEWNLPRTLIQMIGGHHNPAMDRYSPETCIIHLADLLAHACGDELLMTTQVPTLNINAWENLGLSPGILGPMIVQVDRLFRDIVRVFLGNLTDDE